MALYEERERPRERKKERMCVCVAVREGWRRKMLPAIFLPHPLDAALNSSLPAKLWCLRLLA